MAMKIVDAQSKATGRKYKSGNYELKYIVKVEMSSKEYKKFKEENITKGK